MGKQITKFDNGKCDDSVVGQETRFRGDTAPSKLDFIFTKRTDTIENLTYTYPLGKSDHVVLEFDILGGLRPRRDE